jgi:hypothetical protein
LEDRRRTIARNMRGASYTLIIYWQKFEKEGEKLKEKSI